MIIDDEDDVITLTNFVTVSPDIQACSTKLNDT